jgi:6-phosphogluconolactonase
VKIELVRGLPEAAEKSLAFLPVMGRAALSGGTTFQSIYPFWAQARGIAFPEFFPVDERKVPFSHPDSNWGMITERLFRPIGDTRSPGNGAVSAAQYEALLAEKFHGNPPVFDAVFLGLGPDGHIASLFPGQTRPPGAWVVETQSPAHPHQRITLSYETIALAKRLVMVVTAPEKKSIFQRVLDRDMDLPAARVLEQHPDAVVVADMFLLS